MSTFSPPYSGPHSAVDITSTVSPGFGKIFTGTTLSSTYSPGYGEFARNLSVTSTFSPGYDKDITIILPDTDIPVKRRDNRSYIQQLEDIDALVLSSIRRDTSGEANLYGSTDIFTNAIELATAPTITDINIGGAGSSAIIRENVTLSTDLLLDDALIILKKDQLVAGEAAYAIERPNVDDALFQWSEDNTRFELGFNDTLLGTSISNSLSTFADLKVDTIFLDGTNIIGDADLTISSTGATTDLTLTARSSSINLNDVSNTVIDSTISANSLIGILNSLKTGGIISVNSFQDTYTNGEGSAITQGQIVRISANDTVTLSIAAADNADANYIGVVDGASIASAASGLINTSGVVIMRLEGSLALTAGQEVFISASTAGSGTINRPTGSGNIAQSIAVIKDTLSYNGLTNLLVEVHLKRGNKARIS